MTFSTLDRLVSSPRETLWSEAACFVFTTWEVEGAEFVAIAILALSFVVDCTGVELSSDTTSVRFSLLSLTFFVASVAVRD